MPNLIDGDKLMDWLRNYPKDMTGFNPTGLADLVQTGKFSLSPFPKSESQEGPLQDAMRLLEQCSFYIIEKPQSETCLRWNREYEALKSQVSAQGRQSLQAERVSSESKLREALKKHLVSLMNAEEWLQDYLSPDYGALEVEKNSVAEKVLINYKLAILELSALSEYPGEEFKVCTQKDYSKTHLANCPIHFGGGCETVKECAEFAAKPSYKVCQVINVAPRPTREFCADCGILLNEGTAKTFTVCDACWDKHYKKS